MRCDVPKPIANSDVSKSLVNMTSSPISDVFASIYYVICREDFVLYDVIARRSVRRRSMLMTCQRDGYFVPDVTNLRCQS